MPPLNRPRTLSYKVCEKCGKDFSIHIGEEPPNYIPPKPEKGICQECEDIIIKR